MFEWHVLFEGGDTLCMYLGYLRFPMSGLGTCCEGAFGEFECVGSCLFGRVVAGWACVSVG